MQIKLLLSKWTSLLEEGAVRLRARLLEKFSEAPARRLHIRQLEERVMMSAAPIGAEVPVNTETADIQETSSFSGKSVAADADGNFVVAWTSADQDASGGKGVFFQRYDSDGAAVGGEQLVNTTTNDDQLEAAVAMDADGDFVIVWTSQNQDGDTGDDGNIYGQRFDKNGVQQDSEFLVSDGASAAGDQSKAAVAMSDDGDFVVTWTSDSGADQDVYARRFSGDGVAQEVPGQPVGTTVFRVNSETLLDQSESSVALSASGDFVITYSSETVADGDEVLYQVYSADGATVGLERTANETQLGDQSSGSVAMDDVGNFVVAWTSDGDGDGTGIRARTFASTGTAVSGEFWVNNTTAANQSDASIAMDADGDIVVVWTDNDSVIRGREFDSGGIAKGGDFLVDAADPAVTTSQSRASVSTNAWGDYVVAWTADGTATDVYTQRFQQDSWQIIGSNSVNEGDDATYAVRLNDSVAPGNSASVDLVLTDIDTTSADHANFVSTINAAIAGRSDLSFDGTTLTYTSDAQYTTSYNPTGGSFFDISGTGTALNLGDETNSIATIGFGFDFFGSSHNQLYVHDNGYITFGSAINDQYVNEDMSTGTELGGRAAIAAFWDDLDPSAAGNVYVQTIGSVGNREFIAQWHDVPYNGGGTKATGRFQVVLKEATGEIEVRYDDVDFKGSKHDDGRSATIAIQDGNGRSSQHSFNTSSITDGSSVTFSAPFGGLYTAQLFVDD